MQKKKKFVVRALNTQSKNGIFSLLFIVSCSRKEKKKIVILKKIDRNYTLNWMRKRTDLIYYNVSDSGEIFKINMYSALVRKNRVIFKWIS